MTAPKAVATLDQLKFLSELTSSCYRTSNRAWLALMAVAALVLIPRTDSADVTLPFSLGTVSRASFYSIALTLLVAVTIAFAAAHAQAFLGQKLARKFIDGAPASAKVLRLISIRGIYSTQCNSRPSTGSGRCRTF